MMQPHHHHHHPSDGAAPATVLPPAVALRAAAAPAGGVPLMYNRPVTLIDERLNMSGMVALHPLLSDSAPMSSGPVGQPQPCDFTVYAAVGSQHSGKSTVLNAFARTHSSRHWRAPSSTTASAAPASSAAAEASPSFPGYVSTRPQGFEPASAATMLRCLAQTKGVDVLVTPERNILVDTPPLDSAAILAAMSTNSAAQDASLSTTALDQAFQMRSLHTLLLLLESCHVLLVVCEANTLLHTCTLLQRALLLRQHLAIDSHFLSDRPSSSSTTARSFAALPDIVFVVNKVPLAQVERALDPDVSTSYQQVVSNFFHAFPFRKHGAVSAYDRLSPAQAAENNVVNCFVLPFDADTSAGQDDHQSGMESALNLALQELAFQLLSMPKLFVRARTSERDWLRLVNRLWTQLQLAQQEPALNEFKQSIEQASPSPTALFVPTELRSKHHPLHQQQQQQHRQHHHRSGSSRNQSQQQQQQQAPGGKGSSAAAAAAGTAANRISKPSKHKASRQQQQQQQHQPLQQSGNKSARHQRQQQQQQQQQHLQLQQQLLYNPPAGAGGSGAGMFTFG
jgi:hypothetical protein